MRPAPLSFLLALVALGGLGGLLPTARALDPSRFNDGFVPLTPALARFFTDLEAIPAGSTATDAQRAALAADLTALPPGPAAPTAAELGELATQFGALAAAGLVDDDAEYLFALDFDVDPGDADSWLTYVQGDVDYVLHPPPPYDPNNPGDTPAETLDPVVFASTSVPPAVHPVKVAVGEYTRRVFKLGSAYLGDFGARVHLLHWDYAGSAARTVLKVTAGGLPINNPYTVTLTRKSDGAGVKLGELRMVDYTVPYPEGSIVFTVAGYSRFDSFGSAVFDDAALTQVLPDGFDPADLASVKLTDANGRTWVSGGPANGISLARQATIHLAAPSGSAAPTATANARVLRKGSQTQNVDQFHLSARHLPPGTTVTLSANGVVVGQFPTTGKGRLIIARGGAVRTTTRSGKPLAVNALPEKVSLWDTRSISIADAQGNVLLSGGL